MGGLGGILAAVGVEFNSLFIPSLGISCEDQSIQRGRFGSSRFSSLPVRVVPGRFYTRSSWRCWGC